MEENKNTVEKISKEIEGLISKICEEGIKSDNIELLGELIDIHKDIANENYWKIKEEYYMRYNLGNYSDYSEGGNYGNYGRGGRGGYSEGGYSEGSYGRRGVKGTGRGRGRYRGEEKMEEMMYHYGNYSESGQYGAEKDSQEALEYMMMAAYEFVSMLKEEAKSPEETKIIKHYAKKISEI